VAQLSIEKAIKHW